MASAGRTSSDDEFQVRELAESQHGAVSRAQALELGVSEAAIARRVRDGLWSRVLPSVFRITGAPATDSQLPMAATLWAGDGSVVSHATAARLLGITGARERKVELWVPSPRNPRHPLIAVHRGPPIEGTDLDRRGRIAVTSAVRTLIDVSPRMEDDRLLNAVESAFRANLCTPERLGARVEELRTSGRPGVGRLADLLALRGGPALESMLEAKLWLLLCRSGLPLPERQYWVSLPGGRYRLDFAWPEPRVGLECDGWEHHGRRSAFAPDRARLAEFAAAHWHILPVTWHAVTKEPARVERWLRDSLSRSVRRTTATGQ
jgi:very-short-patch-repair endonuclease